MQKKNSEQIQKQTKIQLEQKEMEVNDLKRQLYESQGLANKYMNFYRKSFLSRLFSWLEKDTKLLS